MDAFTRSVAGAPLDLMKSVAVVTMVLESANFVLFDNRFALLWYIDRVTFPVFCLASAVHIARGLEFRGQVASLLLLGAISQPFHAAAFAGFGGANVLITLGIGSALAGKMTSRAVWQSDATLALVLVASALVPSAMSVGWEYGMLGAVLPLAIAAALRDAGWRLIWPVAVLTVMYLCNDFAKPDGMRVPGLDIAFAIGGPLLIVWASLWMARRPRFLHRYALHVVYPGHLAVLVALRSVLTG